MWIKFKCRFLKDLTPEELAAQEEEKNFQELIGNTTYKPKPNYTYDDLAQYKDNIVGFNTYDAEHLSLRTALGEVFIVKGTVDSLLEKMGDVLIYC